tara:strand:- start:17651 stop:17785 length:135 start_codon:yes stop_codon:yes gene_type:complete
MDKIEKDSNYKGFIDDDNIEVPEQVVLKKIVNKINEIIDWINTQ